MINQMVSSIHVYTFCLKQRVRSLKMEIIIGGAAKQELLSGEYQLK